MERIGEHAIVIGASISGLLAARALADAYEQVTVVDRDRLPAPGQNRKAVPQGRHAHVLLASGRQSMEALLPGVADDLLGAGGENCASMRDIRMIIGGHEITRDAVGADVLLASRPLIEGMVRRRVLALANVALRDGSEVAGLAVSPDRSRVTGATLRGPGAGERLHAELVVCATGRGGRVPAWLEANGYPRPAAEELRVDLMYVSRSVRVRPGAMNGDRLVLIGARPGLPRGLAFIAQEDDRWIATASGYGAAHHPPLDDEGYLDFVESFAPPEVAAALRDAEPLDEPVGHAFPANRRRRYERLKRFPDGLLVTGDAIASFNPLYGQGMSVAALEAAALRDCLEGGPNRLARRFLRTAGKIVRQAWDMAVGGDLALPEVEGPRPLPVRLSNAYVERLLGVAEHDRVVAEAFGDVGDLIAPPQEIMRPRVAWRVMRGGGRRSVRAPARAKAPASA